uniref:Uncharacterized protein n=1 Tax=Glossina austeni TaxID=7395 RepID=A0A1A9UYC8_GLOAU
MKAASINLFVENCTKQVILIPGIVRVRSDVASVHDATLQLFTKERRHLRWYPFRRCTVAQFKHSPWMTYPDWVLVKLAEDNTLKIEYTMFIVEYESLRHMIETDPSTISALSYFIPHHGVMEEKDVFKDKQVDLGCNNDTNSTIKTLDFVSNPKLPNFASKSIPRNSTLHD